MIDTELVALELPADSNLILGQSHFIKTVEDLYDVLAGSAPGIKFGIAFCEASGPRLVRHSGNDRELEDMAVRNLQRVGAGHCFLVYLRDAFPINVLPAIKRCPEIVRIFCATANPLQVVVAKTAQGRGVIGVIDGEPPLGVEDEQDRKQRREFLRKIGYKES
jgi:adenosine/AMP kinase